MGETGCGKTRLCKYMCQLQVNPKNARGLNNMYLGKLELIVGRNIFKRF
jgi:hypothetical protein